MRTSINRRDFLDKLHKIVIFVALFLAMCAIALSAPVLNPTGTYLQRVNIVVTDGAGFGSGIVIKKTETSIMVVTCNHVLSEEIWDMKEEKMISNPPENFEVTLPFKKLTGKGKFRITQIIRHPKYDTAIAIIELPDGVLTKAFDIEVAKIAKQSPGVTETVWKVGNGGADIDFITKGIVAGYNKECDKEDMLFTAGVIGGDSGGGVFNEQLELVGITYACEQRFPGIPVYYKGVAVPIDVIRDFIFDNIKEEANNE